MNGIKVIKADKIAALPPNMPVDSQRAVADFRAFYATAQLHVERISEPKAIDVMLDVVNELRNTLLSKAK